MAVELTNRDELNRPVVESQLLTEEEKSNIKGMTQKKYSRWFSSSASGFSSEQGSTESESDQDDDYIAELTRKMTHYMLQDEDEDDRHQKLERWNAEWPELGKKDKCEKLHKKPTTPPNLDFHSKQALIDQQIRTIQVKQEQLMKQQHSKGQKGSEMRAVFVGESESESGSKGTGVFLPRRGISNPSDSRKRTGYSTPTVLIPARVVEALKLHYDRMGIESRYIAAATFPKLNDSVMGNMQQQFEKKSQTETVPAMNNKEIGLPQEWTY
ncbi:uncharacterized protein [Euphorbia lathyris]|uniref:uncharacterized protein isoform X2 n=1 Tax=Euphorbia lathyris TaxID=212925 RepID=UPI00331391DC